MPKLISGFIAKQINKHLGKHVLKGTLVKVTPGARGGTVSSGTNPTEASFGCRLWVASFDDAEIDGSSIKTSDRRINIIGESIQGGQVPAPNDKVIVTERRGGTSTYRILEDGITRDPDAAVYRCHARR
jgi:hypothetical protein